MSLGIYLHVPFCKHACPYCDFYKIALRDKPARARLDLPRQLAREAELLLAEESLSGARLETVYFGGGTPSTLVPEAVGELIQELKKRLPHEEVEVTLEANPENLTEGRSAKWRLAGINRLSIGVQSFASQDLKILERLHERETIYRAVENAQGAGFDNISIDLMFALPGQTLEGWMENLRRAVDLRPQHISFYGLTYHEGTKFEEWLRANRLVELDEDLQAEMYIQGSSYLREQGFEHYEISNFALPGHRSRHNQRYWSRADVLGLGPGAHSNIGGRRWSNPEDLEAWAAAIELGSIPRFEVENLAPDTEFAERLFTALRRVEGVSFEDIHLYNACAAWAAGEGEPARRLYIQTPDSFRLTIEGWLLSDAIVRRILSA